MALIRSLLKKILAIFIFIYLAGCANIAPLPIPSRSTPINSTPTAQLATPLNRNTCNWPPVQVSTMEVSNFFWTADSSKLIIGEKGGNKFYTYTISNGETSRYIPDVNLTKMSDKTPSNLGIKTYIDLFLSPNGKQIIYTQSNDDSYSVYLKDLNKNNPILLGKIKGRIDQSTWINNGNSLILSIDWSSPLGAPEAYVYKVDVLEKDIKVLIPNTSEYRDISYLGLTPDETKLMFASYSGKHRLFVQLLNMADNSVTVKNIHAPLAFNWLPNNKEIIAVGYQNDSQSPLIYIFNIEDDSTLYLTPFEVKVHPYIKNAIQIAPDFRRVAFIDKNYQNLYIIDCSQLIIK